jgi:hypothetical protein
MHIQNYRSEYRTSRADAIAGRAGRKVAPAHIHAEKIKEDMSNSNDSRWWEFYVVRYAMGTVIGALIVYYIFSTNEYLKRLLFLPEGAANLGTPHLALLSVYGLVYCYIASSPILVLHAGRSFLWDNISEKWSNVIVRMLFVIMFPAIAGLLYWYFSSHDRPEVLNQSLAVVVFLITLLLQVIILIEVFRNSSERTINYYLGLTRHRERKEMRQFVESYRHLREHGNAFLIVLFEFWLGFVIVFFTNTTAMVGSIIDSTQAIRNLLIIILLWIFPACLIWFFGNRLENYLVHMKPINKLP